MFKAGILRAQKGCQAYIVWRSNIERDLVVELTDGDFMELLAGKADVLEVGRADDLNCGQLQVLVEQKKPSNSGETCRLPWRVP